MVEIFTDGACRGNPGPGGWGVLLRYNRKEKKLYGGEPNTTNNRMELLAAIKGLEALKRSCVVRLTTDSQYVKTQKCQPVLYAGNSESVDVVVLPHLLEFEPDPHQVLRETERILIGEGHLVILGFNPWSLWGLWRTVLAWRGEPPWCGRFFGIARIKDWLALLGFDIIKARRFYFRPPLPSEGVMSKLELLERIGRTCWPYLGGAYIVVAKKRVATVTPVKTSWRAHRQIISSGIAEPSTRRINNV